jgi:PKHD-type hydroxylase
MDIVKNWFWQYDHAIDKKLCDYFIEWFKEDMAKTGKVGFGKMQNNYAQDIRRNTNCFYHETTPLAHIMYGFMEDANKYAEWDFKIGRRESVQISKYDSKDKGCYDWHLDTFAPDNIGYQRKLTGVLLLSDPNEFEGGQLRIGRENTNPTLQHKGSLVVFPSYMEHKVEEVTKGTRYSVVAWAWGNAFK